MQMETQALYRPSEPQFHLSLSEEWICINIWVGYMVELGVDGPDGPKGKIKTRDAHDELADILCGATSSSNMIPLGLVFLVQIAFA